MRLATMRSPYKALCISRCAGHTADTTRYWRCAHSRLNKFAVRAECKCLAFLAWLCRIFTGISTLLALSEWRSAVTASERCGQHNAFASSIGIVECPQLVQAHRLAGAHLAPSVLPRKRSVRSARSMDGLEQESLSSRIFRIC